MISFMETFDNIRILVLFLLDHRVLGIQYDALTRRHTLKSFVRLRTKYLYEYDKNSDLRTIEVFVGMNMVRAFVHQRIIK